jgi:hypothetical protein
MFHPVHFIWSNRATDISSHLRRSEHYLVCRRVFMRAIDHLYAREDAFVNISTQFHFIYFIQKCGDDNYRDNHTAIDVGEP